jgi:hypothetical protein
MQLTKRLTVPEKLVMHLIHNTSIGVLIGLVLAQICKILHRRFWLMEALKGLEGL